MSHPLLINLSFLVAKPTGISNYALNVIPHFSELDPILLSQKPFADFVCHPIPSNLTPDDGTKGHLRRLLWTQFNFPSLYQQLEARLLFSPVPEAPLYSRCRFVVMVHDVIPLRFSTPYSPLTPYFRYYIPQVLARSQQIVCNSEATANDIVEFYGIAAARITPIPLAYDRQHFRPLNRPAEDKKTKTPNQAPYFLYVGRHSPHKNLHRLVAAFAQMCNCRDYQLWLVGSGDRRYTPKLRAQVQELGLSQQVQFLDYLPDEQLSGVLNQALALVFPSLWEGFGLPVLEAMGCGTPVITSNLSALPEVVGEAGLLIDPYDTQEIAQAMTMIAENPDIRKQLSDLGRQRAQQFSWEKTGLSTVAVLKQCL